MRIIVGIAGHGVQQISTASGTERAQELVCLPLDTWIRVPNHPSCQLYPQACGSNIADTVDKGMGLIGGLAGTGWAKAAMP
eukprot:1156860-Pelagomonas_calceolata.AAC.6